MTKDNLEMKRLFQLILVSALGYGMSAVPVQANPEGAQVVQGSASFSTPSADVLNIHNSNGAVINWQSFSIGPGQTTNFIQPSADSSVLNRVVGNNPSEILGSLNSNGRVFLINQNGLLVGEGATIDTAGFFGSTLNLTDEDFLKGRLKFEGGGQSGIVNRGYIRAAGGNIVLIAPDIENGGVIEVVDGEVLLAAGRSIELASMDNPAIRFEVSAAENRVVNLGRIVAERGAASLFAGTLKHSGDIRASGLVRNADGSISLVATERVEIDGRIDVSGEQGGGAVDVHAPEIVLGPSGRIDASATVQGDGGEIILFAEQGVSVQGEILARGGAEGGDGGFIETSGLQRLEIGSTPDASAPHGAPGTWLVDPSNIRIVSGFATNLTDTGISASAGNFSSTADSAVLTVESIQAVLNQGTNVVVQTGNPAGSQQAGDIVLESGISVFTVSPVTLTLQAHNDIIFQAPNGGRLFFSGGGAQAGGLNLVLHADSDGNGAGAILLMSGVSAGVATQWSALAGVGAGVAAPIEVTQGGVFQLDGTVNGSVSVYGGGLLLGTGLVSGNVDVKIGGAIRGGGLFAPAGQLGIGGLLRVDGGTIESVLSTAQATTPILTGTSIQAGDIQLNAANLMLLWDNAATPNGIVGGTVNLAPLPLLGCINGPCPGMVNTAGVGTVVDPLMVLQHGLAINPQTGTLDYSILSHDTAAHFVTGLAVLDSGWSDPLTWDAVPTATDYVIIRDGGDGFVGSMLLNVPATVAGVQLNAELKVVSGGTLTLNGNLVVGKGGVSLTASNARLSGTGGLNLSPSSFLNWEQGAVSLDIFNWGTVALLGGAAPGAPADMVYTGQFVNNGIVRLDSVGGNWWLNGNFVNNALFSLNPLAAFGIAGTGSIDQSVSGLMELVGVDTTPVSLGVTMNNAGSLWVRNGVLQVEGTTLNQAGGSLNVEGAAGTLRILNGGTLNVSAGVGINRLVNTTGGPVGTLSATASIIQLNDLGLDLSGLARLEINSGQLQGAGGGTILPRNTVLQSFTGSATISGAGSLILPAGSTLINSAGNLGGRITGVDAANPLLFENAGTINTSSLSPGGFGFLSLQFAQLQTVGDGLVTGNGTIDLRDNARLVAGQTTAGSQNFDVGGLFLSTASSELVSNGLVYNGDLRWSAGRISGSGLTTTGLGSTIRTTQGVNSLATTWTIAAGSRTRWSGDNDLLLDGGSIVNQGEFEISIAASGDGLKALTRTGTTETLRNEGLLLIDDRPAGGVIEILSGFDNAGGGIDIAAGTLKIDSDGDGAGDDLVLEAGEQLQGHGTYDGSVINQAGQVSPGRNDVSGLDFDETGRLTITGDFVQGPGGLLRMDLDSTAQGLLADQLVVGGDLVAGGSLTFDIINNKSVLEIAALIDQSFRPFDIGGRFVSRFDSVTIPNGLDFTLGAGGVITIGSDNAYLNQIAERLQALIDSTDLTFSEVALALQPANRRIRLMRSRIDEQKEDKRRRGGPRLVCR